MGYKLKKIYVGTHQVRPPSAYTTFDFTQLSISDLTDAGWVTSSLNTGSNGLYTSSSTGMPYGYYSVPSITSNNKVTIKTVFMSTIYGDWSGSVSAGFGGSSSGGQFYGTYKSYMNSNQYSYRWQFWNGGGSIGSVAWNTNVWYEETLVFDLPNNTLTSTIVREDTPGTVFASATTNISSYVNSIVQEHPYVRIEKPGYYIRSLAYAIE